MNNRPGKKQPNNFAFIDNQNLNLGIQKMGWKMDWRKFRRFLRDKYGITNAYMFIGYMPEYEDLYEQMHDSGYLVVLKPTLEMFKVPAPADGNKDTAPSDEMHGAGEQRPEPYKTYGELAAESVTQQSTTSDAAPGSAKQPVATTQRPVKGNVDAELVLYAVKEMPKYDKAIIISGDGDFYSLIEYLQQKGKLLNLMVPNRLYSTLLKPFEKYIIRLDQRRGELAYRKRPQKREQS